jgi:hypothetical protein
MTENPQFSHITDDELIEAAQAAEYRNELGFRNINVEPTNVPEVSSTILAFLFLCL